MVASKMESAVLDQVVAEIVSSDGYANARANGSTIAFDGFYVLYREGKDDEEDEEREKEIQKTVFHGFWNGVRITDFSPAPSAARRRFS